MSNRTRREGREDKVMRLKIVNGKDTQSHLSIITPRSRLTDPVFVATTDGKQECISFLSGIFTKTSLDQHLYRLCRRQKRASAVLVDRLNETYIRNIRNIMQAMYALHGSIVLLYYSSKVVFNITKLKFKIKLATEHHRLGRFKFSPA